MKKNNSDEQLYNSQLQCYVHEIHYSFENKIGALIMGNNSCCHMPGCIDYFKSIDPNIKEIQTYAGKTLDTVYIMNNNDWTAQRFKLGNGYDWKKN